MVRSAAGSTSDTGAICLPGSASGTPLSVMSSIAAAIRPTLIEAKLR